MTNTIPNTTGNANSDGYIAQQMTQAIHARLEVVAQFIWVWAGRIEF